MEKSPILRSLVAGGRPSGTGRSTSSPAPERSAGAREGARRAEESFERHISRARQAGRRDVDDEKSTRRREEVSDEHERVDARNASVARNESELRLEPLDATEQPTENTADAESASTASDRDDSAPAKPAADGRSPSAQTAAPATSSSSAVAPQHSTPQLGLTSTTPLSLPGVASEMAALAGQPADGTATSSRGAASEQAERGASSTNSAASSYDSGDVAQLVASESADEPTSSSPFESSVSSSPGSAETSSTGNRAAVAPTGQPDMSARLGDNASATKSEAPAPSTQPSLDAERSAEVLRQVRLRMSPELRQAVIQLEPRELGRIAIRISVARGVVRAELRAEEKATLDALQRHAPELKAALERVGLGAAEFALHLGFDDSPEQRGSANELSHGSHRRSSEHAENDQPLTSAQLRSVATRLAAAGGVDTYA